MEEHQELCKMTSARILQSHMKTRFSSGASDVKQSLNQRDPSCYYGLRGNPKKTQKFSGFSSLESSLDHLGTRKNLIRCKECGKGFRYEKCLSNHQAGMHSRDQKRAPEESRASLCGFSLVRKKRSRFTRYKKTRISPFITFPEYHHLSVPAATDEEIEVVECLILLSKSGGNFVDGLRLVSEALEAGSEILGIQDSWSCLSDKKLRTGGEFDHRSFLGDKNTGKVSDLDRGSLDNHQKKLEEIESKRLRGTEVVDLEGGAHRNEPGFQVAGTVSRESGSNEAASEDSFSGVMDSSPFVASHGDAKPVSAAHSDTETSPDDEQRNNVEHRCRTCDRIFSSYQALGGHQTLHRTRNKTVYAVKAEKRRETAAANGSGEHKCGVCWRVFRSVHALGGHKKCHHLRKTSRAGGLQVVIEEAYFGSDNELVDLNVPITGAIQQV